LSISRRVVASQALTTEKRLARQTLAHFSRAQELLRQGDWAPYGQQVNKKLQVVAIADEDAVTARKPFILILSHPLAHPRSDLTAVHSSAAE
jgi:hypothetical protein